MALNKPTTVDIISNTITKPINFILYIINPIFQTQGFYLSNK